MKAAVADALRSARRVLVVNHENPDGDCLGGSLALGLALDRLGVDVVVASTDGVPDAYRFLPTSERVVDWVDGAFDVAVAVECSDVSRAGRLAAALSSARLVVNLDHHLDNTGYGHVVWQDPEAASVCEMVWELVGALGVEVDEAMATCLMTGLLTDTGSFRYASVRPETFLRAAELVRRGARPHRIYERIYEARPVGAVRLLGLALARLQLSADGQVAWTTVDEALLQQAGARWEDTENIVEALRSIAGVRLALLFKAEPSRVKVSLRARDGVAANRLAARFGGGGHAAAAGFTAQRPVEEVVRDTLAAAVAFLGEAP